MTKSILALLCLSASLTVQASQPAGFIIAAYGDSTTAGVVSRDGKNIISPHNEMSFLQRLLRQKYGQRIEVRNHGVPGQQAAELLYNKGADDASGWRERMENSPASLVLINYAINDARHNFFHDRRAHQENPAEYYRIMTALVQQAKAENKRVVLQEPNPVCGKIARWNIAPYVDELNRVAQQQNVPIVRQWSAIQQQSDWQHGMSPDCIHPSETLYQQKAQRTFAVIEAHYGDALAAYR